MAKYQKLKLHNAGWPGLVGKGDKPGEEPPISLAQMIDLTANAEVDGVRFDGLDIFLFAPHVPIDSAPDELARIADQVAARNLVIGSVVAPIWPPTGGGSAFGDDENRRNFLKQVKRGCEIARHFSELKIRPYGAVRIDSAGGPADYNKDRRGNRTRLIGTFREAAEIAADHGQTLVVEGEACWGGLTCLPDALAVLEGVGKVNHLAFQADMAHTLLYVLGLNTPNRQARLVSNRFDFGQTDYRRELVPALELVVEGLAPWVRDFHVAQNDGTIKGSGSHDKTGKHCPVDDPNGKLCVVDDGVRWLSAVAEYFELQHICWDGCMFPNATLTDPATWNRILAVMIEIRANLIRKFADAPAHDAVTA